MRSRRQWLAAVASGVIAAPGLARAASSATAISKDEGPAPWVLGCFNRAFVNWDFDATLSAIRAAGYAAFGLLGRQGDVALDPSAPLTTYDRLQRRIRDAGLEPMMAAVRFNVAATDEARKAEVFASLERAARMGARYALTFGVDRPEHFEGFFRLMAAAVPEAERLGLKMVLKPHGGVSSGPADLLACLDRVGHPNFSIWYDPGNIIYYTGGDPVADLKPIASRVSGLCAKDCDKPKGAVMSQFGTGKVDFAGVVAVLRAAKFAGPVFVEGIQVGPTLEATAANARANREFLDRVLAATA